MLTGTINPDFCKGESGHPRSGRLQDMCFHSTIIQQIRTTGIPSSEANLPIASA
jgi:hypothetical protein